MFAKLNMISPLEIWNVIIIIIILSTFHLQSFFLISAYDPVSLFSEFLENHPPDISQSNIELEQ